MALGAAAPTGSFSSPASHGGEGHRPPCPAGEPCGRQGGLARPGAAHTLGTTGGSMPGIWSVRVQEFSLVLPIPRMPHQPARTAGSARQRGPCASFGQRVPAQMWHRGACWCPAEMGTEDGGCPGAVCASHATISLGTTRWSVGTSMGHGSPAALSLQRGGSVETQPISRRWRGMAPRAEVPQHPHRAARHETPAVPRHTQV